MKSIISRRILVLVFFISSRAAASGGGGEISQPPYYPPQAAPAPQGGGYEQSFADVVFDVLSYGDVGDGVADDTSAFKMAWDHACQSDSPPVVLAQRHRVFLIQPTIFTGPCKSTMTLQIEGTIMPPDGPESWPENMTKRQWLVFYKMNGMNMEGGGVIDGRGEKWWDLPCKPHRGVNGTTLEGPCDSPVAIRFFGSRKVKVREVKMKNSPLFHMRFDRCNDVHIDAIHINAPPHSPNTDGIHIENTFDVTIHNSIVSNGDDCISIGAGCYNVDIWNMTCGPGHGISIGSLGMRNSKACVSNIRVTDSTIRDSDNGLRIKTWQGGTGSVSGVSFDNVRMDDVRNPIIIDQYYCNNKAMGSCTNQTYGVHISGVLYSNIKGTYDVRSPPMHLACSDSVPCTNLTLSEVELYPSQGQRMWDPFCWNAYGDLVTVTIPPVLCLLDGLPQSFPSIYDDHCW
ncbi:unnamed protein product [Cuscuta campestris]|uniref:Polygalacturonase n=1 Tax=Cuscuta campestris TaxID=132261 RepID=A0A484M8L1_9ASTE|nr:unnamed protein product [Cuscuta campestris]